MSVRYAAEDAAAGLEIFVENVELKENREPPYVAA